jgi:hypothetical protein
MRRIASPSSGAMEMVRRLAQVFISGVGSITTPDGKIKGDKNDKDDD